MAETRFSHEHLKTLINFSTHSLYISYPKSSSSKAISFDNDMLQFLSRFIDCILILVMHYLLNK